MDNEATKNMKENLSERVRRTRQSLDEMRAETQAKARRAVRITNNYAHDHPWRVVLTGAALAFTVGLIMRRSPRKIVVRKESDAPVIKVKRINQSQGSRWEAVSAFMPIALFAAKAMMSARANNRVEPEPVPEI
jgi:hypothetical protein